MHTLIGLYLLLDVTTKIPEEQDSQESQESQDGHHSINGHDNQYSNNEGEMYSRV
jgi:hypothetical protein